MYETREKAEGAARKWLTWMKIGREKQEAQEAAKAKREEEAINEMDVFMSMFD